MNRIEELKEIVEKRRLTPCHAFFATYIAALNAAGILTQGVVNFVASQAAETLRDYLHAMGYLGAGQEAAEIVDNVLKALEWGEWRVEKKDNKLIVKVDTDKCRYCPKGVGRAELPATACPLPKLLEKILQLEGVKAKLEIIQNEGGRRTVVEKSEGFCIIRYALGG